ncbi:methyltransferase domain-containing protein [Flavobacteriaceae bacterium F08102]|nr:methyltransferase domain-containing protein [Flavobacteriaceae bacterium F08102]
MQKWLSYIYPVGQKITSKYNGILEITWYNGKKMLNTKNANYSYGSLQKILKIGLKEIDLSPVQNVLVLGLGGGSVIETLRKDFNYQKHIVAVDIDPVIIAIARDEFNIHESDKLTIHCDDARNFMQLNTSKFDLVIIDLFIDTKVPSPFLRLPFWQDIIRAAPVILCNASLQHKDDEHLEPILNFLNQHRYQSRLLEKVNETNTLLIAESL